MDIEVLPYGPEWKQSVLNLHGRANDPHGARLYDADGAGNQAEPGAGGRLSEEPGGLVYREHRLAVDRGQRVVGASTLLARPFSIRGRSRRVAGLRGPVVPAGETTGDRDSQEPASYPVADSLLQTALAEHTLLYAWDEPDRPWMQHLRALDWPLFGTSECLRILSPNRFLQHFASFHRSAASAALASFARASGIGWIGGRALNLALSLRSPQLCEAEAEEVGSFSFWSDELWSRCAEHYTSLAIRNAASLNALLPHKRGPACTRLRIMRGRQLIGWAVVTESDPTPSPRFGGLRLGRIVDCLAIPDDTRDTIGAAHAFLQKRGVDVVVSEQSHPAWRQAFRQNGFLVRPARRVFAASPELQKTLQPLDSREPDVHLTPLDAPAGPGT